MISTNFTSDALSLILTKNVFSTLFCTLVYNLKSNYAETLSRNDVKNIVNTGFYTLGDSFVCFLLQVRRGSSLVDLISLVSVKHRKGHVCFSVVLSMLIVLALCIDVCTDIY